MAVWMITRANLRRKRGVALSMALLIALSAAMLNVGAALLLGIGSFYNRANDELMGAHYTVRFAANEYKDEYLEFFQKDPRVAQAQTQEIAMMDLAAFPEGGAVSYSFFSLADQLPIKGYKIQKLAEVPEDQAVYLPEFMRELNYKPGDEFSVIFKKQLYTFRVAGFSQSTWFQSSVSSLANIYMPEAAFEKIFSQVGGGYYLSLRVKDQADIEALRKDFKDQTDVKIEAAALDSTVMDFSIAEMRNGTTMVVTILSAILLAFSALIVLVVLLAIRFRIANHIETQMHNIGALGAMGYTGRQIRQSIALEFLVLGAGGAVLGILASYGILGGLGGLITHSVGIAWKTGNHFFTDIVSGFSVILAVLLVSQAAAAKAAGIQPVQALRGGIHSHNFSKNHFPLDRMRRFLNGALGLKHMMYQRKMYMMVGSVFLGVAFALSMAVVFYWNLGINDRLLLEMTGYEISDLLVTAAPHGDYDQLVSDIESMEGVRKTSLYETTSVTVEGALVMSYVSDDYSKMETVTVYEGYLPQYDNEIVLTGVMADLLGKRIGDSVEVASDGITADYIVCGLAQTMNNFGKQCYLSVSGLLRINPTYRPKTVQVYLEPGTDNEAYIRKMEQTFRVMSPSMVSGREQERMNARKKAEEKLTRLVSMYGADSVQYALMRDGEIILSGDTSAYQIDKIEDNHKLFVSNVDSIVMMMRLICGMILASTLLIITLVFYMVISSMLVRRSREFGIYKSMGYTNWQLMAQIGVSFMPSVAAGAAAGSLLAMASVNRLSSLLFRGVGISRMDFEIRPEMLLAMSICLMIYSYFICMAVAVRIRKISVYELLTE